MHTKLINLMFVCKNQYCMYTSHRLRERLNCDLSSNKPDMSHFVSVTIIPHQKVELNVDLYSCENLFYFRLGSSVFVFRSFSEPTFSRSTRRIMNEDYQCWWIQRNGFRYSTIAFLVHCHNLRWCISRAELTSHLTKIVSTGHKSHPVINSSNSETSWAPLSWT